jgi:hypothetical protein
MVATTPALQKPSGTSTNAMIYEHTQEVPNKAFIAAALAGGALGFAPPGILAKVLTLGFLASVATTFRSLTVQVDENELRFRFGKGLIKKSFLLKQLSSVRAIRTTPLQGWGVHLTGKGWLYNIYGLDAVELSFHDGTHVLIGTDEPETLVAALSNHLKLIEAQ